MNIIVLELILVAVVAFGLGFWQLRDVNRALREHQEDEATPRRQDGHSRPEGDGPERPD